MSAPVRLQLSRGAKESSACEAVSAWMIAHSIPTGHGDTLGDLLAEIRAHDRGVALEMLAALKEAYGEIYQVPPADAEQERVLKVIRDAIVKAEAMLDPSP